MSDRKYRQRGYQDEPRARELKRETPAKEPRAPGRPLDAAARCSRCGVDLHACIQCVSFDTSARFECSQDALTARVAPKDARNACQLFSPHTTIERETGTQG